MDEQKKLKGILIISIVALFMKVTVFFSPGWAVIGINFPKHYFTGESFKDFGEKKIALGLPSPFADDTPVVEERQLSITLGLWFFVVCKHELTTSVFSNGHEEFNGCFHSSYACLKDAKKRLPKSDMYVRGAYGKIEHLTKVGILEYQIEATAGLIFAISGVVGTILYMKLDTRKRSFGLLACISFLASGTLYLVAIGKVASYLFHARDMINMFYGGVVYGIHVPTPWCLVLGGVAAVMTLIAAVTHLLNLSRYPSTDDSIGVYYTSFEDNKATKPKTKKPCHLPDTTYFPSFEVSTKSDPVLINKEEF